MISFTSEVKNEISKIDQPITSAISELSAILYHSKLENNQLVISTENASVARRIYTLIKDSYQQTSNIIVRKNYGKSKRYTFIIKVKEKVKEIIEDLNLNKSVPSSYLIDDEEQIRSYLRGLFLMTGSVNDPKKSRYHLEFVVSKQEYAEFICSILENYYLSAKYLKRESKYMVYLKEAEKISDFLRIVGAFNAVLYFEDIRIYRDHKNNTNRLNNCEQANVDKIIETAQLQVKNIEFLKEKDYFDLLSEKEKEVANYRIKYNEASLFELSQIITLETNNSITKSGLHHRFNKIKKLVEKIKKMDNK